MSGSYYIFLPAHSDLEKSLQEEEEKLTTDLGWIW